MKNLILVFLSMVWCSVASADHVMTQSRHLDVYFGGQMEDNQDGGMQFFGLGVNVSFPLEDGYGVKVQSNLTWNPIIEQYTVVPLHFYIDKSVSLGYNSYINAKIGMVRPTFGYYNQWRGLPHQTEMIYPPMSLYKEGLKGFTTKEIGIQVVSEHYIKSIDAMIETTLTSGVPTLEPQKEIVNSFFGDPNLGQFDPSDSQLHDLGLSITKGSLNLVYNLIYTKMGFDSKVPFMRDGYATNLLHNFGLRYYFNENLDITGEVLKVVPMEPLTLINIPSKDPYGWLVALRYRTDKYGCFYASYDEWYLNPLDKDGSMTEALTGKDANTMFSKSWSVGHMIKFGEKNRNTLKLQYIKGEGLGSALSSWDTPKWSVTSMQYIRNF